MENFFNKFHEKNIIFDFVYLFISLMVCTCLFLILVYIINGKPLFDDSDLKFLEIKRLIIFAIFIPLVEEFGTRGIFSLKSKTYIIFFGVALTILLLTFITNDIIKIITLSTVLIFCISIMFNLEYRAEINSFIKRNYIWFLLITSIAFGFLHIFNYETINFVTILKIIPRILGGVYLGYIAYKYGIMYSYLMHAINNLIPFIFALIYSYFIK